MRGPGLMNGSVARPSLLRGFLNQQAVLHALILREMQARYGRDNIGFLWMIAEPMMLASVITTLHLVANLGQHATSMGPYPFTIIGYCVFIIFRNSFNRADGALDSSTTLMFHAQITPFDVMLAKAVVEMVGAVVALAFLMSLGIMLGLAEFPARPLYLFGAIVAMALWTFGLMLMIASYTHTSHVIGRFVHPTSYFMFPLSGAFFTVDFLPAWAREYLLWNPMVTIFEAARYGQFETASDKYIYPDYVAANIVLAVCWGLVAIRRVRKHIRIA